MRKSKKTNSIKKIRFFFQDDRVLFILGLLTLSFAILIALAFISYLFTWKTDQSLEWTNLFSKADSQEVENWSGKLGAYFAIIFIDKGFGLASFSLPFLLIIIGIRFFKIRILPLRKTIRISIIGTFLASLTLSYIFSETSTVFGSGPGGKHGYVFIYQWLEYFIGKTGTGLLLITLIIAYIIFSFKGIYNALIKIIRPNSKNDLNTQETVSVDNSMTFDVENMKKTNDIELTINKDTDNIKNEETKLIIEKKEHKKDETVKELDLIVSEIKEEDEKIDENRKNDIDTPFDPTLDLSSYKMPDLDILEDYQNDNNKVSEEELLNNKNKIVETLGNYKISITKIMATIGPTVTLYEIVPAPGVKISKIKNLEDDIALSLAALGIRIIAPIPGKGTIGIEVPNLKTEVVSMKSVLSSKAYKESKFELPIALGKTISNETYVADLAKMPHLLVAGATGQGKSVGLNAIIASLLYKMHPSQLKFVMIDPKKVELTLYSKIEKHYLAKLPDEDEAIITDIQKVIITLNSLTIEMDERYNLLKAAFVRNIKEYNTKFIARKLNPDKGHRFLPYIVLIIDEFADLIMTAGKEIETPIARLAQLARAIGIHLIIATQRPTTNIITGLIKANFPARIAFRVTSMIDSRTILDATGANQLIGRGDMLISMGSDLIRLQCPFIDIPELERLTEFIGSQQGYPSPMSLPEYEVEGSAKKDNVDLKARDELFEEAARLVIIHQQGSTSLIQRKLSLGYNRAGRIIDQLEAAGIVGSFEGSKARQVLFPDEYTLEQFLRNLDS